MRNNPLPELWQIFPEARHCLAFLEYLRSREAECRESARTEALNQLHAASWTDETHKRNALDYDGRARAFRELIDDLEQLLKRKERKHGQV